MEADEIALMHAIRRGSVQCSAIDEGRQGNNDIVKRAIGHSDGAIPLHPLPLSSMPRTMRMAWVVGKTLPMIRAQTVMPRNGNMKPDSMNEGIRVNCASWTAFIWLADTVEKVTPSARLLAMKIQRARAGAGPTAGSAKQRRSAPRPRTYARARRQLESALAARSWPLQHNPRRRLLPPLGVAPFRSSIRPPVRGFCRR